MQPLGTTLLTCEEIVHIYKDPQNFGFLGTTAAEFCSGEQVDKKLREWRGGALGCSLANISNLLKSGRGHLLG